MPDGAVVNLTSSQLSYCYTCIDCSRIGLEDDMTLLSDSFGELDPANSLSYSAAFGGLGNTPSQEYALKSVYYHSALYAHDKGNLAQFVYYSQAAHILLNDAFNSANLHQFPMFPTGYTQALNHGPHQLPWLFNDSITENPGVIPYNSSISINNKTYSVDAPLLRFSNPTAAKLSSRATSGFSIGIEYSSETSILCYNGEVLPSGWLEASTGNLLCIGQAGYTWGLSSTIVLTGLSLQLIWVLGLYVVWLNANLRSKLCKSRRKFDGVYRIAADLIGAMQADLGTDLSSYDNKMFKQELAKCGDIGWFINEEDSEDASDAVLSSKATYREFEKRGKQF
ncbi:hypothetical protein MMC10_002420 [Thelotrema lepadinum]|nr:hypothetical protein [Thelotrema lepadinum]